MPLWRKLLLHSLGLVAAVTVGCEEQADPGFEIDVEVVSFGEAPIGCVSERQREFRVINTGDSVLRFEVGPIEDSSAFLFDAGFQPGYHVIEAEGERLFHLLFWPTEPESSGVITVTPTDIEHAHRLVRLEGAGTGDADGDGLAVECGDCDDADGERYPGVPEVCDGLDNDCDGDVPADEEDGDGDGEIPCAGDCDDGDETTHSGAEEVCDGVDNDCDGLVGEGEADADEDGQLECDGDCDDADPAVYVGAEELCDGLDNDCDGIVPSDEIDDDLDGWTECEGDCEDGDEEMYPGAEERCNGLDDDCDGGVPGIESDGDGDGLSRCEGDCFDGDPDVHPDAAELCDDIDSNCNGLDDEPYLTFFHDSDGDGYGTEDSTEACIGAYPYAATTSGDCDDSDEDVYPGAAETCDGSDENCDGVVDDPTSCWTTVHRFVDADGARCWNADVAPPATCAGYTYETQAWVGPSDAVPGTYRARQCSLGTDHVIVEQSGTEYDALLGAGYDCAMDLGYVYEIGLGPDVSELPFAARCELVRYSYVTAGGSAHLFTWGEDDVTGMSCEPPSRGEVLTDGSCYSSPAPGCP